MHVLAYSASSNCKHHSNGEKRNSRTKKLSQANISSSFLAATSDPVTTSAASSSYTTNPYVIVIAANGATKLLVTEATVSAGVAPESDEGSSDIPQSSGISFSMPSQPQGVMGANLCTNPVDKAVMWCYNGYTAGVTSYIQFYDVEFVASGKYYLSMFYATDVTESNVIVEVDGVQVFGNISTPSTGGWFNMRITHADNGALLLSGQSTIKVTVVGTGDVNIEYLVINSTAPSPSTSNVIVRNSYIKTGSVFRH